MVRVSGSSGDSGFHRESQEDVKVKEEHREEVPTNAGSTEASLNTARFTDQRNLERITADRHEADLDQDPDHEEKLRIPLKASVAVTADLDENRDPHTTDQDTTKSKPNLFTKSAVPTRSSKKKRLLPAFLCRPSSARCLDGTPLTVRRYKTHVNDDNISAKSHKNLLNKNAAVVDVEMARQVVHGFRSAIRVPMQKTVNDRVKKYYISEKYTLLPPKFTWDFGYDEMEKYIGQIRLRVRAPARSTMRKLLALHYPHIRIRSKRSNVCDVCMIIVGDVCMIYGLFYVEAPLQNKLKLWLCILHKAREMRREYYIKFTTHIS
ncbi:hypothetical protein PHMEG_0006907 [Phytophthora megakarya]|uniref:Uncharacterized protein n=1 Tax=Phytophthora megakarya TaxID=4795 RepID=A0A225WMQ1_9STRA|nr:hypothetical protein PHMEG_0006907 [Phytophthora megakarya]